MSTLVRSLKNGSTPQDRVIVSTTANTTAPVAGVKGYNTLEGDYLHLFAKNNGAGGNFDVLLWGKYSMADEWFVLTWFGSTGSLTVNTTPVAAQPAYIGGLEEVYVQVVNLTSPAEAQVWVGCSISGAIV